MVLYTGNAVKIILNCMKRIFFEEKRADLNVFYFRFESIRDNCADDRVCLYRSCVEVQLRHCWQWHQTVSSGLSDRCYS